MDRADPTPAPADPAAVLGRRSVYILPTAHGIAFAAALAVMLVGSVNYSNSLGYVLTFLLGSVGVVSLLHAYRNLAGLKIRLGEPEPTFAGGVARVPVTVDNRDGRERFAVAFTGPVSLAGGTSGRARAPLATTFVAVPAGGLDCHRLALAAPARGVHDLSGLVVASRFPLGLFRAWSPVPPRSVARGVRCVVYPAPRGTAALPWRARGGGLGPHRAGEGREDFAGLREYRRGDPPKHVHWKALARGQGMLVKEFAGERGRVVDLGWGDTAGLADAEARLSQLALWVLEAEAAGLHYALRLPARTVPAGSGHTHLREALEALAAFPPAPETP